MYVLFVVPQWVDSDLHMMPRAVTQPQTIVILNLAQCVIRFMC